MAVAALQGAGAQVMFGEAWPLKHWLQRRLAACWWGGWGRWCSKHAPEQIRGLLPGLQLGDAA